MYFGSPFFPLIHVLHVLLLGDDPNKKNSCRALRCSNMGWNVHIELYKLSRNQVVFYHCTLKTNSTVHVCYVFYCVAPCDLIKDKTTCQVHFNSSDCVWNDSTSSCLGPERCVQPKISGETVKSSRKSEPEHKFCYAKILPALVPFQRFMSITP